MTNINRDYMVIIDVKSGSVNKPTMVFYNTDKNTSNIYAQLVVKETIVAATPIENATDFAIELKVVKPGNVVKFMDGVLVNEAEAIYEFDLPEDFTNLSGNYDIEFWVKAKVNNRDEMITSSKAKYTVKPSILTDLDEAIEDHDDYPLFLKLMEEVKVINETAHELDTTIRTLQADMIEANNEMKTNEATRQANEATRVANEATRIAQENAREEYLNTFDGKWEEYKANTDADIADYKTQINAQESVRNTQEQQRQANEQRRIANEDERKIAERQRKANENERKSAEQSRVSAENARANVEEVRQTNEANRETAEEIRKANEQARIAEHEAMRTEHEQTMTAVNEVKAENAILMENDKKVADRMTQVEISDKRQYVIMEGLMNSTGDGYLKIEDTGNDTTLYNSVEGFVDVKNITGNTMVNSIKNPDDELTLNADINTSGQSVTLTTAVDGGQVDVLAEGNTMVNVCDQQEAVAITKSYTVETGNHVALHGEYDGKARPVPTGNTLVNIIDSFGSVINAEADFSTGSYKCTANGTARHLYYKVIPKTSTTYTAIAYVNKNTINDKFSLIGLDVTENNSPITIPTGFTGLFVSKFTTKADNLDNIWETDLWKENTEGEIEIKGFMILEGDYTNKPIPDYFTGMKSSFEDKLVTQEMVDSGKELAENLGKYRVDYKVTGKNKIPYVEQGDISTIGTDASNTTTSRTGFIPVKYGTTYTFSQNTLTSSYWYKVFHYDKNKKFITMGYSYQPNPGDGYIRIVMQNLNQDNWTPQLEEGSTATPYEPYKESIKTYYLNSPLLEEDTIEESGGNVYHVHRYGKVILDGNYTNIYPLPTNVKNIYRWLVYSSDKIDNVNANTIVAINDKYPIVSSGDTYLLKEGLAQNNGGNRFVLYLDKYSDGSDTSKEALLSELQSNPITVVYKLASPQYELISQSDTILTDSYVAGHLDFDTAVPVEKVAFRSWATVLKYLYPSIDYLIQFEADNNGIIYRSGSDFIVSKGINKMTFTTDSNPLTTLGFNGIGFSASNIVVTEATDKDFGYFQGMKSVGELEENKIEILSANKNLFDINKFKLGSYGEVNNGTITVKNPTVGNWDSAGVFEFIVPNYMKGRNLSLKTTAVGSGAIEIRQFNKDSKQIFVTVANTEIFKILDDCYTINLNFNSRSNGVTTTWSDIQLELSDLPTDYIPHAENKKQILLNEPLRAIGDTKDRFIQIDGKWYVERNCTEIVLDGNISFCTVNRHIANTDCYYIEIFDYDNIIMNNAGQCISEKFSYNGDFNSAINVPPYSVCTTYTTQKLRFLIPKSQISPADGVGINNYFANNPTKVIVKLASPTYEPVEIAPTVNTYTDVTHITNNSTIPMNMPIVNSGYEIIAKPNTKYTVVGMTNGRIGDSTIVNGTITTPVTITDNFLRPYGTGTTSKVMLLEGEPANMPGYFKGIKSVFEDKVTEDGKYACQVRVYNDLGEETVQTLYLDEPLYNANNITIYNDKLGYWKNWDKVVLDGSDDEIYVDAGWSEKNSICRIIYINKCINNPDSKVISNYLPYLKWNDNNQEKNNMGITIGRGTEAYFAVRISKSRLSANDTTGFKQYLSQNPLTVVYQLAEPVFVPLIDNCPNWVIGSWDNCSIHFDSIIPLKDTRYRYTGNVPSVVAMSDDVAETKSISDEQDAMIVDLATDVAVMEMMLM